MDIDELKIELEAKQKIHANAYNALKDHIKRILEANIDNQVAEVKFVNDSGAEIRIKNSNHSISLYYYRPYSDESHKLEINFGCFGSFSKDDKESVQYCEVLGHLAGILSFLEDKIINSPEAKALFSDYYKANHDLYETLGKIRNFEAAEAAKKRQEAENEILSKICNGKQIVVCKETKWHDRIVKTIAHITSKNILFEEDYGTRTKKDEFVNNILNGKWEFA